MSKVWFKRKKYGYGWYPATWQGWFVIFEYVIFVILNFRRIDMYSPSATQTLLEFLPSTALATLALLLVTYLRGESPRWQWGEKNSKTKSSKAKSRKRTN